MKQQYRLSIKLIITKYLYYFKMAKEMSITCDFIQHNLHCVLPEETMDIILKVCTRSGEHTFREDVYTRTLKYRKGNNELRPFHSLKRRVVQMFWKRNSCLDSSRGTYTQTIVNKVPEQCKAEEKDSETDSERESIHSHWSKLVPVEVNKPDEALKIDASQRKRTVRNIVLVPYKPRPKDWGSWKIKYPYATSTITSPPLDNNNQAQDSNPNQTSEKLGYIPHSPYYEPVHPLQFYEDE